MSHTRSEKMKAILVQPPFTQLNAPYPAVHYLEAFLRGRGASTVSYDHSIDLYRRVFSRKGLTKVFADARAALAAQTAPESENSRTQVERYLSYERLYIEWIDGITSFLSGSDPAMAHRLASAVELPQGARAQAFLDERDGRIGPDEARSLATRILDDLGDFIAHALDPDFGTVRYAERLASSRADFGEVRRALDSSWLINEFYIPMLEEFWAARAAETSREPIDLILITIPFPGCLIGALACARVARGIFGAHGPSPRIVFGGGYVSTELRGLRDTGIFDFCDYLSFDAGYGSLASIIDQVPAPYKTMTRRGDDVLFNDGASEEKYRLLEREAIATVFPDFRSVDFGAYLRIVDSENPMHRLWSDTPWLKYSLAHGCYWRRCSFCDTELEYVSDFVRSSTQALLTAAGDASARSGLYGIHFVDEAMPMASLLDFARANRARASGGDRPFSYWGNVRFDASWTQGRCEFLAASGLVAVSGGIEIATERGLRMTDKGFDLASLVRTLVAMRRAGLLVHTYLIYGFPGQPVGDIVDSAEFCRQLFASGLVDSAFWHRFVLTRHSRMYREWRDGKRQTLKPSDKPWRFANNDLSFAGEEAFDRFDAPLAAALSSWMEGNGLDMPVSTWLGRGLPKPSISPDLAETLIASAEEALDAERPAPKANTHWIAGLPMVKAAGRDAGPDAARLAWVYRGEMRSLELPLDVAKATSAALSSPPLSMRGRLYADLEAELALPTESMAELLSAGLVVV